VRPSRFAWRSGRPKLLFTPREAPAVTNGDPGAPGSQDARAVAGSLVRRSSLDRLFEPRRPFDDRRPGALDREVSEAVRSAGFSYMWTKTAFGRPHVALRDGEFIALTLTAGNWDGWSPFYTVGSARDLKQAERRLLREDRPGWLAGTIDSPLWLLSGELLEHGAELHRMADLTAGGGASGRLVNVTPGVIARYARLLESLRLLG
jgi:hypothetical protein